MAEQKNKTDGAKVGKDVASTDDKTDAKNLEKKPAKTQINPEKEFGGPKGPEPTRYGDWEQKGRCTDF